jgi:hypothetical protein
MSQTDGLLVYHHEDDSYYFFTPEMLEQARVPLQRRAAAEQVLGEVDVTGFMSARAPDGDEAITALQSRYGGASTPVGGSAPQVVGVFTTAGS